MKVQEVILKAAAGKLKWWGAAEILGCNEPHDAAPAGACREQYADFNVRHFHEKLVEHHGIHLTYC